MKKILFVTLLVFAVLSLSACTGLSMTRGSGNVVTETREVSGFDQLSISGVGEVILVQGEQESLKIEAEDNILPEIETVVRGSTLYIGFKDGFLKQSIVPTRTIKYYLTMKDVKSVDTSGAANLQVEQLNAGDLRINLSGAGNVNIGNLSATSVHLDVSGAGNIEFAGKVDDQQVNISGAGKYDAGNMESQTASIELSGTGSATVWATNSLDIQISGMGSVNYYGDPANLTRDVSGLGTVKNMGSK